jgi:hypothetical protein
MSKLELTDAEKAALSIVAKEDNPDYRSLANKVLAFCEAQESSDNRPTAEVNRPKPRRMQGNPTAQNPDILLRAAHLKDHDENHACGLVGCIPVPVARPSGPCRTCGVVHCQDEFKDETDVPHTCWIAPQPVAPDHDHQEEREYREMFKSVLAGCCAGDGDCKPEHQAAYAISVTDAAMKALEGRRK